MGERILVELDLHAESVGVDLHDLELTDVADRDRLDESLPRPGRGLGVDRRRETADADDGFSALLENDSRRDLTGREGLEPVVRVILLNRLVGVTEDVPARPAPSLALVELAQSLVDRAIRGPPGRPLPRRCGPPGAPGK